MIAEGIGSYKKALELIQSLGAAGIGANITACGVSIDSKDKETVTRICKPFGASVSDSSMSDAARFQLAGLARTRRKI